MTQYEVHHRCFRCACRLDCLCSEQHQHCLYHCSFGGHCLHCWQASHHFLVSTRHLCIQNRTFFLLMENSFIGSTPLFRLFPRLYLPRVLPPLSSPSPLSLKTSTLQRAATLGTSQPTPLLAMTVTYNTILRWSSFAWYADNFTFWT